MLLNSNRRRQWRKRLRVSLVLLSAMLLLDLCIVLAQYSIFQRNLILQTVFRHSDLPPLVRAQQIFIAAQFWSSEDLLRIHWIDAFVQLVAALGSENVYVSILCSHGLDNTEDAIRELDMQLAELGVSRSIVVDPTTHEEIVSAASEDSDGHSQTGWLVTDTTKPEAKERRRISYLAELRNRALELLQRLHDSGRTFDRILYLNDVIFEPKDIFTLLATNEGFYDVACGLDYHLPPALYDTFAVRDMSFRGPITSVFPYFTDSASRNAMLAGQPTPVTSCWNGVIVLDASPFYDKFPTGQPDRSHKGLRFRAIPDSLAAYFVEASECCLIHADLQGSGRGHRGTFINPAVRTAYAAEAYEATHLGSEPGTFVSAWQYWSGVWVTRLRHWWKDAVSISAGQNFAEVYSRIRLWEKEDGSERRREVGEYCVVLEMQILVSNGWKHIQN